MVTRSCLVSLFLTGESLTLASSRLVSCLLSPAARGRFIFSPHSWLSVSFVGPQRAPSNKFCFSYSLRAFCVESIAFCDAPPLTLISPSATLCSPPLPPPLPFSRHSFFLCCLPLPLFPRKALVKPTVAKAFLGSMKGVVRGFNGMLSRGIAGRGGAGGSQRPTFGGCLCFDA